MEDHEHTITNRVSALREHLKNIQKELSLVIGEIGVRYQEKTALGLEIKSAQESLSRTKAEEEEVIRDMAEKKSRFNHEVQTHVATVETHNTLVKNTHNDFTSRESKMREREVLHQQKIQMQDIVLENLNKRILVLTEQEGVLLSTIEDNRNINKELEHKRFLQESDINSKRVSYAAEIKQFENMIESIKKEIQDLNEEISKKIESVKIPEQQLQLREEKLGRIKRDLDIYQLRIKNRWEVLYPGQALNI